MTVSFMMPGRSAIERDQEHNKRVESTLGPRAAHPWRWARQMMRNDQDPQCLWIRRALAVCAVLFLCANAYPGPLPPPMEVELDLARNVVVGRIAHFDKEFDPKGGLQTATATIEVSRTLKGPEDKTVSAVAVVGIGTAGWSGAWAPNIRKKGDAGVWILGNASDIFGLVSESRLGQVEHALKFLSSRTWTPQTNGLQAWAGVFHPQYESAPHPWLALAIRNVSARDVYYPLDAVGGIAVAEDGTNLCLRPREDDRGPVFCRRLAPGCTEYVLNYFFAFHFREARNGAYTVTLTYANVRDGETSTGPAERIPVQAWKGVLAPPPFRIDAPSQTKADSAQPVHPGDVKSRAR